MTALPLIDRPANAPLFVLPTGSVLAGEFLADATSLAANLTGDGPLLNLCKDRYTFAVAFVAALVRGQVSLLCGEPSPSTLTELARHFPDAQAITDDPASSGPIPTRLARFPRDSGAAPVIDLPPDRLAALVFTSGSTGQPTAHEKRWGTLVDRSRAAAKQFGYAEASPPTMVGTVPPGHMYGFETTVLLPLHAPCASWCGPAFFPGDVQSAFEHVSEPILVTTPLQLRALVQGAPPRALRACISATAPLDNGLAAQAEAHWQAPMLEIFGATEVGSIASRRTLDGDAWRLYPGVTLLRDADEVRVHADWAQPVALADDIEQLGQDRFRLLGRRTDTIKLGGRRASLTGLNRILTELEGVREGTFIVPDDLDERSNARLVAVVIAPDRSASSILADLRARVDPVFVPRRVIHVDALPRTAMGKLPRAAILELLMQAGSS